MNKLNNLNYNQLFFSHPRLIWVTLGLIFTFGLLIRLYDLTDLPLDYHPTRQLASAVIARGMYYQGLDTVTPEERETAVLLWKAREVYEPQLLERLVATTYHILGGEYLWVSRIYTSLFWIIGGVALYLLVREMSTTDGAIIAVAYYMFLPFGVIASRSFQPDPIMVSLIILSLVGLCYWRERPTWRRALMVGVLCGIAILVKAVAIFPITGAFVGLVLGWQGFRGAILNRKVWTIVGLALLPAAIYYVFLTPERAGGFYKFWVVSFSEWLLRPAFYVRWANYISDIFGFHLIFLSLLGVLMFRAGAGRGMVIGLWVGYVLYGMFLPYQITTHDYYHLMLIPILGLCLAPPLSAVFHQLTNLRVLWRIAAIGILILACFYQLWTVRVDLVSRNFRNKAKEWEIVREAIPRDGKIIALSEAYGYQLEYFALIKVPLWPRDGDIKLMEMRGETFDYDEEFANRIGGIDYFLVTDSSDFDNQEELKTILYENYPIYDEGDEFVIFDLNRELDDMEQ
jgi:4-amino-4-deoxy-L-arabinose transferase-like glycosyltransferase